MPEWLSRHLTARLESVQPAVDLAVLQESYIMQSILEILVINVKEGTAKKTGAAYRIPEAHCVLRNDDDTVACVGVLVIPKDLEEVAKVGQKYTASFALDVAGFGENQGRIVARLVGLTPIPPGRARSTPATATA